MRRATAIKLGSILAALVLAFTLPYVLPSYYVSLVTLVLTAALLAMAVNLLAGQAGLVSMGHAGIAAAAGYGVAWSSRAGHSLATQLLLALGLTLLTSVIYGLISMRTKGIYFLMVTLAAGMVCYGVAFRWSSVTGGDNGLTGIRRPAAVAEYWQYYFLVLLMFVLTLLALMLVSRSPFGLVLRGVKDSDSRLRSLGYNIAAYKFTAIVLSGLVAGLAGVLTVWNTEFISPDSAGVVRSALAVVMIVLGGLGTTLGPLVGAGIVVAIEHILSSYVERWQLILGLLFILAVIFAPSGLVGSLRRRRQRDRTPPVPDEEAAHPADPHVLSSNHPER
ncbi:branched-chain amino acid ABC transporter permease [Ruania zhangjianzhongii]|uniref:branched-chain amino acid ABC transporter permease n=1 Tax=Ruania zhangjianzhongii TaxID=2603206 RepID=UPI0011CB85C8|nr:branched-chain amino acid ABC transporter permease [Ruania zhangjianzhongii]